MLLATGIAALVALAITGTTTAQPACTIEWDGGGDTDFWDDPANWRNLVVGDIPSNRLPTSGDHVCLPATDASRVVDHRQGTIGDTGTTEVASIQLAPATEGNPTPANEPLEVSGGQLVLRGAESRSPEVLATPSRIDTLALSGGRLDVNGPEASSIATMRQTGGTLHGTATTNVRVLAWTGGRQDTPLGGGTGEPGTGRTVIEGGGAASLEPPSEGSNETKFLSRALEVRAGASAAIRGPVESGDGGPQGHLSVAGVSGRLENHGSLVLRDDQDIRGDGSVRNAGTLTKQDGTGTSLIEPSFGQDGTLVVDVGTLEIRCKCQSTHTGTFDIAGGATLLWGGGTHVLTSGETVRRKPGTDGDATAHVNSGFVTVDTPWDVQRTVLDDGRLDFEQEVVRLPRLEQSGGTLGGDATVTVGDFRWAGGSQGFSFEGELAAGRTVIERGGALRLEPYDNDNPSRRVLRTLEIQPEATATIEGPAGSQGEGSLFVHGRLVNAGSLTLEDDQDILGQGGTVENTGTLRKASGTATSFIGPRLTQDGTVDVDSGELSVRDLRSFDAQTGTLHGGTYLVSGTFSFPGAIATNAAAIVLDGEGARIDNSDNGDALSQLRRNAQTGDLRVVGGKELTAPAPNLSGPFTNEGNVTVGQGSSLTGTGGLHNAAGGTLRGGGTIGSSVTNDGTVGPGASPGTLAINGNYTQGPGGTLDVEIDGRAPGTGYDRLEVTGDASLAGTLAISSSISPATGERFDVLTTGGDRTGTFGTVTGAEVTSQRRYQDVYEPRTVALVVARQAVPSVSIDDVRVNEGDADTVNARFRVSLSAASDEPAQASFVTENGTATAPADYESRSGTVQFAPGETTKVIDVPVVGDTAGEPNETFFVRLSGPSGATVADDRGTGTITDDDAGPTQPRQALPPPVVGQSFNLELVRGVVLFRNPGARRPQRLRDPRQLRVGARIDTRRGRARLTSAANLTGATQTADFFDGLFQVRQRVSAEPITDLLLRGSVRGLARFRGRTTFSRIEARPAAGEPEAQASARRRRRLFGSGRGRFRSRGRFSSATVRGTDWLVEDFANGTLSRVTVGSVLVRDFVRDADVLLGAGQSYFARAPRPARRSAPRSPRFTG
ncbi:MAG: hypothetical protein M3N16_03610 [Actinomycetota bacterium]|nr:hypothetical protein [Actinomycetota bacterium]